MTPTQLDNVIEAVKFETPKQDKSKLASVIAAVTMLVLIVIAAVCFWFLSYQRNASSLETLFKVRQDFIVLADALNNNIKNPERHFFDAVAQRFPALNTAFMSLAETQPALMNTQKEWQTLVQNLLSQKEVLIKLPPLQATLENEIESFTTLLQEFASRIGLSGAYSSETIRQVSVLTGQAQKIRAQVALLIDGKSDAGIFAVAELSQNLLAIEDSFNHLLNGDPSEGIQPLKGTVDEEIIFEAQNIYRHISSDLAALIQNAPELLSIKTFLADLEIKKQLILNALDQRILQEYNHDRGQTTQARYASILLVIILLMALGLIIILWYAFKEKETVLKYEAYSEKERNERHEMAIMRIINELQPVREGDLSIELSITDDSTGVIADCINVTIENLRDIVLLIRNEASAVDLDMNSAQENQIKHSQYNQQMAQDFVEATGQFKALRAQIRALTQHNTGAQALALQADKSSGLGVVFTELMQLMLRIRADAGHLKKELQEISHVALESKREFAKNSTQMLDSFTQEIIALKSAMPQLETTADNLLVICQRFYRDNTAVDAFMNNLHSEIMTLISKTDQIAHHIVETGKKNIAISEQLSTIKKVGEAQLAHIQKTQRIVNDFESSIDYFDQHLLSMHDSYQQIVICDGLSTEYLTSMYSHQQNLLSHIGQFTLPKDEPVLTSLNLKLEEIKVASTEDDESQPTQASQ